MTNADLLEERVQYLRNTIIPRIDAIVRAGRRKAFPEVASRLRREYDEFQEALQQHQDPASCVAEIADIVYYGAQADEHALSQALQLANAFGLQPMQALEIAIAKYEERTKGIKDQDQEKKILADYLQRNTLQLDYDAARQKLAAIRQCVFS